MSKRAYMAFKYAGSKRHLMPYVDAILANVDTLEYTYIEPFLGSGTVYYNLKKDFKNVILNDIDKNIIALHNCFKQPYEVYKNSLHFVESNFGNIKESKEAYYALRKFYNENSYDNYLLLQLANSCMNSMLRFGPNGMNQSFGHCHYKLSEDTWKHLRQKILQANILNDSYLTALKNCTSKSVIFVDPPYNERIMPYSLNENYIRQELLDKLVSLSYSKDTIIMYTDVDNKESDFLLDYGFKKKIVKGLRSICPTASSEETYGECLYCNIL